MNIIHAINWVDWKQDWRRALAQLVLCGLREAKQDNVLQVALLTDCLSSRVPDVFDRQDCLTEDASDHLPTERRLPFLHGVMSAAAAHAYAEDWIVFSNADAIPATSLYSRIQQTADRGRKSILTRAHHLDPDNVVQASTNPWQAYQALPTLPFQTSGVGLELFAIQASEWQRIARRIGPYVVGACRWDDAVRAKLSSETDCWVDDSGIFYHIAHPSSWDTDTPTGRYNRKIWELQMPSPPSITEVTGSL